MTIPDAPWISETESTGFCRSGWWNNPPEINHDEFYDVVYVDDDETEGDD